MALQDKYNCYHLAKKTVSRLSGRRKNNVLHIGGKASESTKQKIWMPTENRSDMRAGDLMLNMKPLT